MSPSTARRLAWSLWVATMLLLAAMGVLVGLNHAVYQAGLFGFYFVFAVGTAGYATAGAVIAARVRGNPVGWIMSAVGLALLLGGFGEQYGVRTLLTAPGSLPGGAVVVSLTEWIPASALVALPIVFLLFPSGRVHSPRWRWVLRALVGAMVLSTAGRILAPVQEEGAITNALKDHGAHPSNVFGVASLKGAVNVALTVGAFVGLIAAVVAIASLIWRYRRASGEEREQVKWLAFSAIATLAMVAVMAAVSPLLSDNSAIGTVLWVIGVTVGFGGIPAAVAVAVLKYRLYDVDVVINKTVVFGALAAFITAVYVGIVVGIGAAIGAGSDKPNLALSILATAVVAVAFQPVRERVQRFANRLVYGKRATPYEVLSEFSSRVAGTYASEDLLPRMARALAEGTGAKRTAVWLHVGAELRPAAVWPGDEEGPPTLPAPGETAPELPGTTLALPVHHRGELLGVLSLTKAPGERLTPAEEKLSADLAAGAGLVLRNVRLTEELLARLDELQASRQRLVAAQDEERRRLERNIHDGAQQQLVALALKTRLVRQLAERDQTKAGEILGQTEGEITQTLEDLRNLARGIYPPLLADRGLVAALESQARRAGVPVTVEADGVGRYPQEAEAAVYFCVLEALQNVAKYANATAAVVRLSEDANTLALEVTDNGGGFDTSLTSYDRAPRDERPAGCVGW